MDRVHITHVKKVVHITQTWVKWTTLGNMDRSILPKKGVVHIPSFFGMTQKAWVIWTTPISPKLQ